jgi:hypothetical protein
VAAIYCCWSKLFTAAAAALRSRRWRRVETIKTNSGPATVTKFCSRVNFIAASAILSSQLVQDVVVLVPHVSFVVA